jgi:hypothetical protein
MWIALTTQIDYQVDDAYAIRRELDVGVGEQLFQSLEQSLEVLRLDRASNML